MPESNALQKVRRNSRLLSIRFGTHSIPIGKDWMVSPSGRSLPPFTLVEGQAITTSSTRQIRGPVCASRVLGSRNTKGLPREAIIV
jgi:hypothetical protein